MPVAYAAVGSPNTGAANATGGFNPSVATSFTVNYTVGQVWYIDIWGRCAGLAGSSQTVTCTSTGGTVTQVGTTQGVGSTDGYMAMYRITWTTSGTKTVNVGCSGGGNTGRSIMSNGVGYTGWSSFATLLNTTGTGTTPTINVSGGTSDDRTHAFVVGLGSTGPSSYSGTTRFAGGDGGFVSAVVGDAAGNVASHTTSTPTSTWRALGQLIVAPVDNSSQFFAMC